MATLSSNGDKNRAELYSNPASTSRIAFDAKNPAETYFLDTQSRGWCKMSVKESKKCRMGQFSFENICSRLKLTLSLSLLGPKHMFAISGFMTSSELVQFCQRIQTAKCQWRDK